MRQLLVIQIAWLIAFIPTLAMPLFTARVPFISRKDISVASSILELANLDVFLCLVVVTFGVLAPIGKALATIWLLWTNTGNPKLKRYLLNLARISMLDVFLIAILIVGVKGLGVGRLELRYGIYVFTIMVLASLLLSALTDRGNKSASTFVSD